jgi:hypothetical protein
MSNFIPPVRTFHPAVPMLGTGWHTAGLDQSDGLPSSPHAVAIGVAGGEAQRVVVVGFSRNRVVSWQEPEVVEKRHAGEATLKGLVELRWHLRDVGTSEDYDKIKITPKHNPSFILPEQTLAMLRAGMISVAEVRRAYEDPKSVVNSIGDNQIQDYVFNRLDNMFFHLSDIYVAQGSSTPLIATEGGFDPAIKSALFERFEVNLIHRAAFANSIYRAAWNYLRSGGNFMGDWGSIARIGQNLYMMLAEKSADTYADDDSLDLTFE